MKIVKMTQPESKTNRLTKDNIEQIEGDYDNRLKTVETERSILDKFNSAKKSQHDQMSNRSKSQMSAREHKEKKEAD